MRRGTITLEPYSKSCGEGQKKRCERCIIYRWPRCFIEEHHFFFGKGQPNIEYGFLRKSFSLYINATIQFPRCKKQNFLPQIFGKYTTSILFSLIMFEMSNNYCLLREVYYIRPQISLLGFCLILQPCIFCFIFEMRRDNGVVVVERTLRTLRQIVAVKLLNLI